MENKILEMEQMPVGKLLFKYSITVFWALLFSAFYNLTDALFVSYGVGDKAMAGVAVAYPFMMLQGAFAQMVGGGAAVFVTKHLGKKEYKKAGNVTFTAMVIFYCTTLIVSVFCLAFSREILIVFGATSEIMEYSNQYFLIIAAGNVFSTGFSSIIRAEGRMKYSLLIWLVPTAVNILFDYIFVFVLKIGVTGVALATVICQFTSFLMSILFFTQISCQIIKPSKIKFSTVKNIFQLGIPVLIQAGGMSIIVFAINNRLSAFGNSGLIASFAYVAKIIQFAVVPFTAVTSALAPIVGYNGSAGNFKRVNNVMKYAFTACYLVALCEIIISFLLSNKLMQIFTKDISIINYGSDILKMLCPSVLFIPFILIVGAYFQALANKKQSLVINLFLIAFTVVFIFIFSKFNLMWWGVAAGSVASFVFTLAVFLKKKEVAVATS